MDPRVAFTLPIGEGIRVYWYGIIIATALVIAVIIGCLEAKRRGYRSEMVLDFMLLAIPLGVICARLFYVAFFDYAIMGLSQNPYFVNPHKILFVWEGGLSIFGAVIGGALAAFIFNRWRKVSLGSLLDIAAPSIILAQSIGRWGNYVNQEAHGVLITNPAWQWFPAGVQILENGQLNWYMATFFYESVWNLLAFAVLMLLRKKIRVRGGVFALYGALYGFARFWIESFRTDSLVAGGLLVSQFFSGLFVVCGILYLVFMPRFQKELPVYDGYYSISWTPEQIEEYKNKKSRLKKNESNTNNTEDIEDEKSAENDDKES